MNLEVGFQSPIDYLPNRLTVQARTAILDKIAVTKKVFTSVGFTWY